jgi:phosphohistidine phosphatase SixA
MALADWATQNLERPDTVLCSPARRTRETLAPLLAKWPRALATTDYVESMYGASLDMLLRLASDAFSYSQRLLMVGHNPGIQAMLAAVAPTGDTAGIRDMATGTLAVVAFAGEFKSPPATGRLLHLLQRGGLTN